MFVKFYKFVTPYICKGTLDIKFQRDWSVGLGAILGDSRTQNLNIF